MCYEYPHSEGTIFQTPTRFRFVDLNPRPRLLSATERSVRPSHSELIGPHLRQSDPEVVLSGLWIGSLALDVLLFFSFLALVFLLFGFLMNCFNMESIVVEAYIDLVLTEARNIGYDNERVILIDRVEAEKCAVVLPRTRSSDASIAAITIRDYQGEPLYLQMLY